MTTASVPSASCVSSPAWTPFTRLLAEALAQLDPDEELTLKLPRSRGLIRFKRQPDLGLRLGLTAASAVWADPEVRRDVHQALLQTGWTGRGCLTDEEYENQDIDHVPESHFREFGAPVDLAGVAAVAVDCLRQAVGAAHPRLLEYLATDRKGRAVALPRLGLNSEAWAPMPGRLHWEHGLEGNLLATLRDFTGIVDLPADDDGRITVDCGATVISVRPLVAEGAIEMMALLFRDVEDSDDLRARLNHLNRESTHVRYFLSEGMLFAAADAPAEPFIVPHVTAVFEHFARTIAHGADLFPEPLRGRAVRSGNAASRFLH